jgi:hypothetical protein
VVNKVRLTSNGSVDVAGRELRVSKSLKSIIGNIFFDIFWHVFFFKKKRMPCHDF